jgi:predicted ATP-dependent Lon-type protease
MNLDSPDTQLANAFPDRVVRKDLVRQPQIAFYSDPVSAALRALEVERQTRIAIP